MDWLSALILRLRILKLSRGSCPLGELPLPPTVAMTHLAHFSASKSRVTVSYHNANFRILMEQTRQIESIPPGRCIDRLNIHHPKP